MLLELLLNHEPYKVTFGRLTEVQRSWKWECLLLAFVRERILGLDGPLLLNAL